MATASRPLGATSAAAIHKAIRSSCPVRHISSGTLNGVKWFNSSHTNFVRPFTFNGDMHVVTLGTASGTPTRFRNVSASVIRTADYTYLFDCGEGTQTQLKNSFVAHASVISRIFITHLHGDHVYGLPGVVTTILADVAGGDLEGSGQWRSPGRSADLAQTSMSARERQPGPPNRLTVYGPLGLHRLLSTAFPTYSARQKAALPVDVVELLPPGTDPPHRPQGEVGTVRYVRPSADGTYYLYSSYADPSEPGGPATTRASKRDNFKHGHHDVRGALLEHAGVQCVGYVLAEQPRFRLDPSALTSRGLPQGHGFRDVCDRLKAGQAVPMPNGSTLTPEEALRPAGGARKVVIMGDNSAAPAMVPLAAGADLVLHEATLPPGDEERAARRGHSTSVMAGRFARACGAKTLVLTHFSNLFGFGYGGAHIDALGLDKVQGVLKEMERAEALEAARPAPAQQPRPTERTVASKQASSGGYQARRQGETSSPASSYSNVGGDGAAPGAGHQRHAAAVEAPRSDARIRQPSPRFSGGGAPEDGPAENAVRFRWKGPESRGGWPRPSSPSGGGERRDSSQQSPRAGGPSSGRRHAGDSSSDGSVSGGFVERLRVMTPANEDSAGGYDNSRRHQAHQSQQPQSTRFRKPQPPPRGSRGMTSLGVTDDSVASDPSADASLRFADVDGNSAHLDTAGSLDPGSVDGFSASESPRQGKQQRGRQVSVGGDASDQPPAELGALPLRAILRYLEVTSGPRAGLLNGILETRRVRERGALGRGAQPKGVHVPWDPVRTTPRSNLFHALSVAGSTTHGASDVSDFAEYEYPAVHEHGVLAPVVRAAQEAFGRPSVVAARDFMVFPLPLREPDGDAPTVTTGARDHENAGAE